VHISLISIIAAPIVAIINPTHTRKCAQKPGGTHERFIIPEMTTIIPVLIFFKIITNNDHGRKTQGARIPI